MKSIMLSQKPTTFINFYILCSNFTKEQKEIIDSISKQHSNCKIEYIDMGKKYKEFTFPNKTTVHWTTADFYRLELQNLFLNEKKMLYLDGDTLIYKDLNEIYNYNISNKFYVGMLEMSKFNMEYSKKKIPNFINTGVILCNLEELRKGNIYKKYIRFYIKNKNKINAPVNEPLNIVSHVKNDYFGPEYVTIAFCNEFDAFNYYSNSLNKVNKTAVLKAYKDPYIYHLINYFDPNKKLYLNYGKPWKKIPRKDKKVCVDRFIRFYEMARKTDFYYEILEKFKIY